MRRLVAGVLAVAAAALGVAGFSSAGGSDAHTLAVELDEWGLTPSRTTVPAGRTTLVQRNSGRLPHELVVVRTDVAPDALAVGLSGVKPSLAGRIVFGGEHSHHDGGAGTQHHVEPGAARRAAVRLRPGRYVLLCGIDGHYEAGQRAALTVE